MTAHSLSLHREGKPRRDSFDIHDPRAQVFRPIDHGVKFVDAMLKVFDEWDDYTKQHGQRHAMGQNCRKVLRALFWCCNFRKGTCEPSLDALMAKTKFARATVVRALKVLWANGFIDWIRRTVKTDNAPGEGPPVIQTTNAYFFDTRRLPERCFKRLRQLLSKAGKTFKPTDYPRPARYEGLQERRAKTIRNKTAYDRAVKRNALARATSDEDHVRALYPGDLASQRAHLEMMQSASSESGLNPLPNRSIQKE
ncbi:MAG: hypothetical protein GW859_02645 [Sphingomonadales bacterium]|nr:hypothetical protein [Sphingomonadales bacterium]